MAKATSIKIDTTEATKIIEDLQFKTDNLKAAMLGMKEAGIEAQKAMKSFVEACGNIDLEKIEGKFSLQ